jgi:hypothetical protein
MHAFNDIVFAQAVGNKRPDSHSRIGLGWENWIQGAKNRDKPKSQRERSPIRVHLHARPECFEPGGRAAVELENPCACGQQATTTQIPQFSTVQNSRFAML